MRTLCPSRPSRLWLTALLVAAIAAPALAFEPPAHLRKARYEVVTDRTAYQPGERVRLAAWVIVEPGWHVNSNQPSEPFLIPTELEVTPPGGWGEVAVTYPAGKMQKFTFADVPLSVYDGEFRILAEFTVPPDAVPGPMPVELVLGYQACDDSTCLGPVRSPQTLQVMIGPGGEPANLSSFDPTALTGPQPPAAHGSADGRSLWSILLLALLGGLILNAMPCVLPVLSLKLFGLVRSAGEGRRSVVTGALATTTGILVSFWVLAGAAIAARAAGSAVGWGVQFQNPVFVAALAVVVLLFCLNLWGLFEIQLPGPLAQLGGAGQREGLAGHFGSGLFTTLMATPCSAPFLGVAVGFALTQKAPTVLAVFTAVGLGMALPYLALAAVPKAAEWLPKPGAWMDTLKGVLGFLLAGGAIWLLFVLSSQISSARLAFFQLALLLLSLFVWLRHKAVGAFTRRLALVGVIGAIALTLWLPAGATPPERGKAQSAGLIDWVEFDRAEAEQLAREGNLVFVDVTADWCITCKVNERLILETDEVAGAFEEHGVIAMKADWTNRDPEIFEYLSSFGRGGIPFYALYLPNGETKVFSELPSKSGIVETLQAAGGGQLTASH